MKFGIGDTPKSETETKSKVKKPAVESRIPAGATQLVDKAGVVRGYKTADGKYVQLAEVAVSK
jgi:non-homologous end joining protein Ku